MAIFNRITEEELVARAAERFRRKIADHETAQVFAEFLDLVDQFDGAADESEIGALLIRNYSVVSRIYDAVYEDDFKHVKRLVGTQIGDLFVFFQKVMTAPFSPAPSASGAGAEASQDAPIS